MWDTFLVAITGTSIAVIVLIVSVDFAFRRNEPIRALLLVGLALLIAGFTPTSFPQLVSVALVVIGGLLFVTALLILGATALLKEAAKRGIAAGDTVHKGKELKHAK